MHIVGRKAEKKKLASIVSSDRPEFVVVYGRRRVGKTYLIREYFERNFCFQFTGYANATKTEQLIGFNEALNKYGKKEYPLADSWLGAFNQLIELLESAEADKKTGRKAVFLDEMPWMDTPKSKFLIGLEHFWNGWADGEKEIMLIVCGSATTWLTNKVFRNTGGLYNRVTRKIYLRPFTLRECEEYFDFMGMILNQHQMLESYMIFGGIPFYLRMMDASLSLHQNIDRLCFDKGAPLSQEFDILYSSLFRNPEKHSAVIEALSKRNKGLTREEIIKAIGTVSSGTLTRVLAELEQSDFIQGFTGHNKARNDTIWQLSDPFSLFFLKFMRGKGLATKEHWVTFSQSGTHNAWSGYAFEQVCLAHIEQIRKALGITGVHTLVSSWRSSTQEPGAQIDLVIDRNDHIVNLCEMKYSVNEFEIGKAYSEALLRKRLAFAAETKTKKALHQTLVTVYGLRRSVHSADIQSVVTADDLFEH